MLEGVDEAELGDDDHLSESFYATVATLELAGIDIERERFDAAERRIERASKTVRRVADWERDFVRDLLNLSRARLDLAKGDAQAGLAKLKRGYQQGEWDQDSEALLVLAAASKQVSQEELLGEIINKLSDRRGDAVGWELLLVSDR